MAGYVAAHIEEHPTIAKLRDELQAIKARAENKSGPLDPGWYIVLPHGIGRVKYWNGEHWEKTSAEGWPGFSMSTAIRLDR